MLEACDINDSHIIYDSYGNEIATFPDDVDPSELDVPDVRLLSAVDIEDKLLLAMFRLGYDYMENPMEDFIADWDKYHEAFVDKRFKEMALKEHPDKSSNKHAALRFGVLRNAHKFVNDLKVYNKDPLEYARRIDGLSIYDV